ncbi:hypothetical protein HSBAA_14890 [Vreelandella sulfidaeris]|uniref:CsbD-like domain-containing protein n=1 Tax=Vreelandella sulfidaeris TaxID=115553 RepID=A0A455U4N7_9GAMM|nr:hypothetical protein HSBAA_14890 [Halomonas sulfidaeris]
MSTCDCSATGTFTHGIFPTNGLEVFVMATGTEDKAKGAGNKAAGKAKEAAGKATDNHKTEAKGKAQQAKGEVQKAKAMPRTAKRKSVNAQQNIDTNRGFGPCWRLMALNCCLPKRVLHIPTSGRGHY